MSEPVKVTIHGCPCRYNRTYTAEELGLSPEKMERIRRYSCMMGDDGFSFPEFICPACGLNVCAYDCPICDAS